jgi:small subunit ribosomal protein S20
MPQTASAAKALRASARRRTVNDRWRAKVRSALKAFRVAITTNNKEGAAQAAVVAESMLDRAARRNIIHWRAAARKKSRLKQALAKTKAA